MSKTLRDRLEAAVRPSYVAVSGKGVYNKSAHKAWDEFGKKFGMKWDGYDEDGHATWDISAKADIDGFKAAMLKLKPGASFAFD